MIALAERLVSRGLKPEPPVLAVLTVRLPAKPAEPQPAAPEPTRFLPPPEPPRNASADRPRPPVERQTATLRTLSDDAARSALQQLARELPYPPEAVAQGLEGEAKVLLFLNAAGD